MVSFRVLFKTICFAVFCLLMTGIQPVKAGYDRNNCLLPRFAQAEQALSLHSELLVIALNCNGHILKSSSDTYTAYETFTKKHKVLISEYERAILDHYKRNGVLNPEKELNRYRTELVNKISGQAATMRPDIFCYKFAARLDQAGEMTQREFRRWASTDFSGKYDNRAGCKTN